MKQHKKSSKNTWAKTHTCSEKLTSKPLKPTQPSLRSTTAAKSSERQSRPQQKAYKAFKDILPEDNPYLKNSKENLDIFLSLSVSQERHKNEKAKMIGSNKPQTKAQSI